MKKFKAFRVESNTQGAYKHSIEKRSFEDLPKGDVLIKVEYSSLNYKDALSAIGNRGVSKSYPHTPGIDAAGIVVESTVDDFDKGDAVIVTGYDLGMNTDGGFSEYIRVPGHWPVKLPKSMTLRESMIYGTAGFTAALSLHALIDNGITKGHVLVSGATGGVGSRSIRFLKKLGYEITAITGKAAKVDFLKALGADSILLRDDYLEHKEKLMNKGLYHGFIDTVGGEMLSTGITMLDYDGTATTCGNIAGHRFNASIYPFILRGAKLIGIYSANCKRPLREKIWEHLSSDWQLDLINDDVKEITMDEISYYVNKMLDGESLGRIIISMNS